jgi:hypothetical protein
MAFKDFTDGEVLYAADVDTYLMRQTVMVFADSAARGSALGTAIVVEGMVTYLQDTNGLEYYDGSAWQTVGLDPYTVTSSTATAYTATTSDVNSLLQFTSASAVTVTISTATSLSAGQRIDIIRDGAGTVTVQAASTAVTIAGAGTAGTAYTIGDQYDAATIIGLGTDTYRIIGNITAV